jgi:hypothetical protein
MFAGRSVLHLVRRTAAGGIVTLLALAALAGTAHEATSATVAATGSKLTNKELLVGGYFAPKAGDYTKAGQQAEITKAEAAFGKRFDLVQSYYPFNTPFPTWRESWNLAQGRTPVIAWNGITDAASVAAGSYDAMIRTRARDVAALGAPVVMRFAWEMDGYNNPVKPASAADYVAQWRRIHRLFAEEGATNVIWMWCPNAWGFDNGQAPAYYPGDDVVDWVGADGYDLAPLKAKAKHQSFESIFAKSYDWAKSHNKPFTIGEFGALEDGATYKAEWVDAARNALTGRLAGTKAVLAWSHEDVTYDDKTKTYNFRMDSSPAVAVAWARWATATNGSEVVVPPVVTPVTNPVSSTVGAQVVRPRADRQGSHRPMRAAIRRVAA